MRGNPLHALLQAAFPPTPILAAEAFGQRGIGYCDAREYRQAIDGKTWEQVDPVYVVRRSDALCFLGDRHLAELLPVYLHLLLVFGPMSLVPESLLPLLTKPEPEDRLPALFSWRVDRFEGMTRLLTEVQNHAVAATLHEYIAMHANAGEPAKRALDRHWGAFAEGRKNPLHEQLRAAFPATKIVAAGAFGTRGPYRNASELEHAIDGKTWEQLELLHTANGASALAWLGEQHFLALLPMYLHLLIVLEPTSGVPSWLLEELTRPDPNDVLFERKLTVFDRVRLMTDAQKSAVAATLRLFIAKYPHQSGAARVALERYWHAF